MNHDYTPYLKAATLAARQAGALLREHTYFHRDQIVVDALEAHDIKLALDKKSQALIQDLLLSSFPNSSLYGEEGEEGDPSSAYQWIVDPIDGTVNFFYGLPHFAISIALKHEDKIVVGVIYDPIREELWQAVRGGLFTLNGEAIQVSKRTPLSEAIVSVGLSKTASTAASTLPLFHKMLQSVRKCRIMGSATLDIAYVASARLDLYVEQEISLWDIAAGILMVEMGGGIVELVPHPTKKDKYSIIASQSNLFHDFKTMITSFQP